VQSSNRSGPGDHRLMVYVTKSPGVPVAEAAEAAQAAVAEFQQPGGTRSSSPPQVVYDGYSIGASGSI
jgi:hypothetical protein